MHTTHPAATIAKDVFVVIGEDGELEVRRSGTAVPRARAGRLFWNAVSAAGLLVVLAGAALLLVPHLLGYERYVIVGGSMEPTVDRGSVVFSEDVPVADLAVGDVITYQPPPDSGVDTLVTHRIIDIGRADDGSPVLQTKGDANAAADPWHFQLQQPRQNVVRFDLPMVGHALVALANPQVRMVIVGVPAAFIALGALAELAGVQLRAPRRRAALG